MIEKVDISNADEEARQFIHYINKEKYKTFILPYLCTILMLVESVLDLYIHMKPLITITFIFVSIVHAYVLYKLKVYQINLSNILSAIQNGMTLRDWASLTPDQVINNDLKLAKLNWRSLVKEYGLIMFSCCICMSILFVTVIAPYFFE